jgi:hypothetical protein
MSSHTCYRTSRSFHFPFGAVCSLSGTQPEFSLGWVHPHVEKDIRSLLLASSQFNVLRASTRVRRPPGPTWPGSTRAEAAQHQARLHPSLLLRRSDQSCCCADGDRLACDTSSEIVVAPSCPRPSRPTRQASASLSNRRSSQISMRKAPIDVPRALFLGSFLS